MSDAPEQARPPFRVSRKALAIGVALGLLAAFASAWFFTPPDVIAEPVHLSRDDEGVLVREGDGATANGARLKVHLGALKARNNTLMTSSEVHSNPGFLAANRLAICNESDHLLIARVATSLLELLKLDSSFSEIDYFPEGQQAAIGELGPDLYLTLNLQSIDESGLLGRDLHAVVSANFGSSFAASNFNSTDNQSPPTVALQSSIEVDHTSSLTGVESSAAQYEQQGNDIAKQISKHILDKLKTLREKHDPLPELPTALYPEWAPEPDFAFLARLQARRLNGVHGLMLRNESHWEYVPSGDPMATVTAIRDELLAEGWKEDRLYTDNPEHFTLQMSRNDATLGVFPDRRSHSLQPSQMLEGDGERAESPVRLKHFVRYRDRLSRAEINAVVDGLFAAEHPDITLLLAMQKSWQGDQHSRAIQLIEEQGVRSAEAWLLVAESYSRRNDLEGTRRALACCRFLTHTLTSSSNIDQKIRKIAREQKIDDQQLGAPEPELLRTLGFVALDPAVSPTATVTVRFGEPAAFYMSGANKSGDKGKPAIFSWTVSRLQNRNRFRVVALEVTGGNRSWSTEEPQSLVYLRSFEHEGWSVKARVEDESRDTLTIRVELQGRNTSN